MTSNRNTNSNWLKDYKSKLFLTDRQKEVLIGTLLGDGSIKISVSGKAARLQICQSFDYKEYVFWKKNIFKEWVLSGPKYYKVNNSLIFRTVSHPEIYKFYSKFYKNKVKIIPKDINDILKSNLSLAVWFMDDGNGYQHMDSYRLSTYAFGYEGNLLLQKCLLVNFGLKTNLVRDSRGFQIYIPVRSGDADRFKKLVMSHIIPKMRYKFRNTSPVETDLKK